MRRALVVPAALVALLPAVAAGGIFNPVAKRPAPSLSGTDPVTGKRVTLAQWAGRPLLVNLWGSWCHPCNQEAPILRTFLARHAGSLLGIDVEDSKAGARRFQQAHRIHFPSIFDPKDVMALRLKPPGTPTTYFLDRRHRIVAVVYEPVTTAQLDRGWKLANTG
ncbi:MAG TPA: TlpA disulfide reductase family protein [Gaiellaceae bacterium]|nr:TlpA disulfide reductase family protein [Gaiellaceae bacterium]